MVLTQNSTKEVLQQDSMARSLFKFALTVFVSFLFVYINTVMFITLYSKPALRETPRYVLFANMLLNDSIQLLFSSLITIIVIFLTCPVTKAACATLMLMTASTTRTAPLNLAVMSLERYAAICFPLRHKELATIRKTYAAIGVTWFLGFVNSVIDWVYSSVTDPVFFTKTLICDRLRMRPLAWQRSFDQFIDGFYYAVVTLVIVYSYIRIMMVARSVSNANAKSARKGHGTLLLHLIQLLPCLNTLLYGSLVSFLAVTLSFDVFLEVRYLIYLLFILIPRCLSPLVYGLRDDTLRCLFMYYFKCGLAGAKPKINVH